MNISCNSSRSHFSLILTNFRNLVFFVAMPASKLVSFSVSSVFNDFENRSKSFILYVTRYTFTHIYNSHFPLNMSEPRKEFVGRQFYAKVSVFLN